MADSSPPVSRPFIFGANHRSCGLSTRDRLFVEDGDVPQMLSRLNEIGVPAALILSTCDRIEIQGQHEHPEDLEDSLRNLMAEHSGLDTDELAPQTYIKSDLDAVHHIFSVAASLDSQVVGEPQVLGQLKAAHRLARQSGASFGDFEGLLQAAYNCAKRVRTETAIGERPVSIAAAAADLARDLHGDLSRVSVLMIGVGELGEMIARHLLDRNIRHLGISHPIISRADTLARQLDCHRVEENGQSEALCEADVIVCAMGRRHHILNTDMVRSALKARRNKPQFIIDTGIPGDVEPAVHRLDEAFVYDINDLENVAMDGKADREQAALEASKIVDADVDGYINTRLERDALPTLTALRQHFEDVREQVLAEVGNDPDRLSQLLINRLLDQPSRTLRDAALITDGDVDRVVRRLFDLKISDDKENSS